MSTDRQQDAGLDRLVRAALRGETPPEGVVCPDADAVAAYTAGTLSARERTEMEPHLAACQRCQAVLAMLAADAESGIAAPTVGVAEARTAWFGIPRLRWLVPAGAVALAAVLYVAVKPGLSPLGPRGEEASTAAVAPEQTVAKGADMAEVGAQPAAKPMSQEARARAVGRSEVPAAAANEMTPADAAKAESALALAEKAAVAPAPAAPPPVTMTARAATAPPSRAAPAGAAAGNFALAAPQEAREKAVDSAEAFDAATPSLDALWRRAEIVVIGRPAPAGSRADKDQGGIVVLESLKQPEGAKVDLRLLVTPAQAGASRVDAGTDYVYFLTRVSGADGTTRLVTVGSVSLDAARRDDTLARLRQLAAERK